MAKPFGYRGALKAFILAWGKRNNLLHRGLIKARLMSLQKHLAQKKAAIIKRWFKRVMDSYPADTARFLGNESDPFANPVGQTTQRNLAALFDLLGRTPDPSAAQAVLDPIIRIRAIQDFSPAQAIRFVFDLKDVIRDVLPGDALDRQTMEALTALDGRIDELGLMAFDIYMQCREKIYELKANEVKDRTFKAFARAGLIAEPADNE